MKKTQLFLILFYFTFFSNAQQNNIDSLKFFKQKAGEFVWTNKDSAYHYFNKVKILSTVEKDWVTLAENYINTIRSAAYHSRKELDLETISKNLDELDMFFIQHYDFFSIHPDYPFYKNCLLNDRATYYFQLDDYSLAQDTFDTLIENILTEELEELTPANIDLLLSAYIYKAKMYSDEGKYELAKEYFERNLRLLQDLKPDDKKSLFANYSLIGELYKCQDDYEKSNSYFIPSLKHKLVTKGKKNGIITDAQNIFSNYIQLKQIDSATVYLELIKDHLREGAAYETRYHHAKAELYKATKNYESALEEQQKVLTLFKEKWTTKKHLEVAQSHRSIGLTFSEFNKPKKAIHAYNLAIDELTDTETINSTVNKTELLKIYKNKVESLIKLKSNKEAFETANVAIHLLDSLKPSFKTETDKLFIVDQAYPIFETGLKTAYNLYTKTQDSDLIDQAFFISEKSKSTLLLEALLSAKVTTFKTVPDSLLTKEKQLKSEINFIEKKINKSKTDTDTLKDALFNVKKEYNDIVETIETKYKSYYDLKYNSKVASIKDVQAFLDKNDVLLSCFYGKESLFVISVTKTKKHFTQIKLNKTIENLIKEVYILLSNPKSDLRILNSKSFSLFNLILEPHLKYENKKKLIVLADGLLSYIPFSALTTKENNYKYLVEDYAVSYVNSATLLLQIQEYKQNNNAVLAFAPTFNNSTLLPLPNNKKEAQHVLSHFNGDVFSGTNATLENFNKNNSKYSILHLATHAIFDDATPEYSYLAFASDSDNDNSLYVRDLYNLDLNADLVTLSACESGIGDLKRGEGLMSLARGFYFSGAKSIASTLWKINDASSSKLMDDFYLQLSKNDSKPVALQKAKVRFINTNRDNALSHPYFWSGFVISGNTHALNNYSNYWLWGIGGLGFLIVLVVIYFKSKKKLIKLF